MQNIANMSGNGNIGRTGKDCGKYWFTILLLLILPLYANAQEAIISCYDSVRGVNSYYPIQTKFIDLNTKMIIATLEIATEGELVNIRPVQINRGNDTLLVSAINTRCYCKNTSVGDYNAHLTVINKHSRTVVRQRDIPHQIITGVIGFYSDSLLINGSLIEGGHDMPIDGYYQLDQNSLPEKVRDANIYIHPNTISSLDRRGLAYMIASHLYYDIYESYYYLIKTDARNNIIDTLRLENYESRNSIFAVLDTIIYVFSLNYELHFKGRIEKGYGQDWIDANVRMFNIRNFVLLDSLSLPDYPEGDFISGSYGVGEVKGPFITYYFGESGDMQLIYPGMLFIFDTRTNEATWLRVGWR